MENRNVPEGWDLEGAIWCQTEVVRSVNRVEEIRIMAAAYEFIQLVDMAGDHAAKNVVKVSSTDHIRKLSTSYQAIRSSIRKTAATVCPPQLHTSSARFTLDEVKSTHPMPGELGSQIACQLIFSTSTNLENNEA